MRSFELLAMLCAISALGCAPVAEKPARPPEDNPEIVSRKLDPFAPPDTPEALKKDLEALTQRSDELKRMPNDSRRWDAIHTHHRAVHEARTRAAGFDSDELLKQAIWLELIDREESPCSDLDDALETAARSGAQRALAVLIDAGLAQCGVITLHAIETARKAGHEAAAKQLEAARDTPPKGLPPPGALAPSPAAAAPQAPVEGPAALQERGAIALNKAAGEGDFVMVKAWLDRGISADAVDPQDPEHKTPLINAERGGHESVVKLLLARGAKAPAKRSKR